MKRDRLLRSKAAFAAEETKSESTHTVHRKITTTVGTHMSTTVLDVNAFFSTLLMIST